MSGTETDIKIGFYVPDPKETNHKKLKEISLNARETIKNFSEDGKKDIEVVFYRLVRRLINEKKSLSFTYNEEALLGSELKGLEDVDLTVVYSDVYYYDDLVL